jgi:hypothetical protein
MYESGIWKARVLTGFLQQVGLKIPLYLRMDFGRLQRLGDSYEGRALRKYYLRQ